MKRVKLSVVILLITLLVLGCASDNSIDNNQNLGNVHEITYFLPEEQATWIYKGTGVYHHEMTLEDIIKTDQLIYYKIKGEVLSDQVDSDFEDYQTEIRYVISKKGWQQELDSGKVIDSKYKGMYLLRFPIEVGNQWEEKVLDFNDRTKIISASIQSIDSANEEKTITVKYSEKNSDYYEIRKIKQGRGIVAFEKNEKLNNEYHKLSYSLDDFYYQDETVSTTIKKFLTDYNNAWQAYYNKDMLEVLNYYDETSDLEESVLNFDKSKETTIDFINLSIHSIEIDGNQYRVYVEESFRISNNEEEYIQSNDRTYVLTHKDGKYKIIKVD